MTAESTPVSLKQETRSDSEAIGSKESRKKRGNPARFGALVVESEPKPAVRDNPERANTMTRAELMDTSGSIIIEGTNLRQMYETHLVGERGMRRIVAEYLRGGNLHETLKNEILERQRDFERDPALRGRSHKSDSKSVTGPSKAALDNLLQKADVSLAASSEQAAFLKARGKYEARRNKYRQKRQRLLDVSLIIIIAILVALVIGLFLRRH